KAENINLPGLYFSHERKVFERDGQLLADAGLIQMKDNEQSKIMTVRFRTIGDITCTGAMISSATTVDEVILEIAGSLTSERGTRSDDKRTETAMEDRKKSGYF
ncbi:sulfate adenylyltransferase small subunit, partial [Candidatus Uhrbacteria bacterium CG_4_10_14_0_2_um_filter_41_7]